MKKSAGMLTVILIALAAPALADDGLASRDWSVAAQPSLEMRAPTMEEVQKAVTEALHSDWNMNPCNYVFVDPAHDGTYRLIVAFDGSGYHTCNRIAVVEKKGHSFNAVNDWQTRLAEKVSNNLIDLDRDGHREMIIPEAWSKYEPGRCMAMFQHIYKWDGGRFADHSRDYPDFYKARLKELADLIPKMRDPSCFEMERDKIMRFLGMTPKAGYAEAMAWMKDPLPFRRRLAAAVFADIKDAESKSNLAILKSDSDALVAETAKSYLESPAHE